MDDHDDWRLAALANDATRISKIIRDADLTQPVAHLNRWKVRDVVAHLGGVHRWATRIVQQRSMAGPGFTKSKLDGQALCDWFDEGAQALVAELATHDAATSCPNFNPGSDNTVGWWTRRQAHETAVHRWDIEAALSCVTPIPAPQAVDGVDEFLDVFVRTRGKQTLSSPLVLRTTRPRQSRLLSPATKPGRIDVQTNPATQEVDGSTEVSGKPEALLLALWGRLSATDAKLKITGDPAVAASLLAL